MLLYLRQVPSTALADEDRRRSVTVWQPRSGRGGCMVHYDLGLAQGACAPWRCSSARCHGRYTGNPTFSSAIATTVNTLVHAFWSDQAADAEAQVDLVLVHTMCPSLVIWPTEHPNWCAQGFVVLPTYTDGLCQSVIMGQPTRDQSYQSLTTRAHVNTGDTRSHIALPRMRCYSSGSSVVA